MQHQVVEEIRQLRSIVFAAIAIVSFLSDNSLVERCDELADVHVGF